MKPRRLTQQGFAAVAAIFLVVMLAAFGTFMVSFSNTQQLNSARDVQGSRAYWAARAGLEWAIAAIPANLALCANPVVAPPTPIDGFAMTLRCYQTNYTDGTAPVKIIRFESVASKGTVGTVGYVERSVSASMER